MPETEPVEKSWEVLLAARLTPNCAIEIKTIGNYDPDAQHRFMRLLKIHGDMLFGTAVAIDPRLALTKAIEIVLEENPMKSKDVHWALEKRGYSVNLGSVQNALSGSSHFERDGSTNLWHIAKES